MRKYANLTPSALSHHAYVGNVTSQWVTTDFALQMFHRERATAIDAYRRFIAAGMEETSTSPLRKCKYANLTPSAEPLSPH